jgi:hypothetical protein
MRSAEFFETHLAVDAAEPRLAEAAEGFSV